MIFGCKIKAADFGVQSLVLGILPNDYTYYFVKTRIILKIKAEQTGSALT